MSRHLMDHGQVRIQRGGGQGVRTPWKTTCQVIWVSIVNKRLDPPPPGKRWTPSGTLKMIVFFEIDRLTSAK